jgi:microcystin-dependent protein
MADPFLAEITMFAGNFAPRGWAYCSGSLLPISQNSALFSLLGTNYGGDGRTTFGLPDLRGRSPRGSESSGRGDTGPGLTAVGLGQKGGSVSHTLTSSQIPSHTHLQQVSGKTADSEDAAVPAEASEEIYVESSVNLADGPNTADQGGGREFSILNPYLGLNYIIATQGTYPSRN